LLSEGAKVISWSSFYSERISPVNWGLGTAVDNLLSPTKTPWSGNGEAAFIFGFNDSNQKLTIDLGQVRNLDQIGADVSFYPQDREVWDYFEVRVSLDNVTYTPWGLIGAKDGIPDITTPSLFITSLFSRLDTYLFLLTSLFSRLDTLNTDLVPILFLITIQLVTVHGL
jgi:hypothetical protein